MRNHGTGQGALMVIEGTVEHRGSDQGPAGAGRSSASGFQGVLHTYRADAGFLAQLLAVRTQAPAQRAKRRAAPEVGAAAYRSGLGLLAAAPRGAQTFEA